MAYSTKTIKKQISNRARFVCFDNQHALFFLLLNSFLSLRDASNNKTKTSLERAITGVVCALPSLFCCPDILTQASHAGRTVLSFHLHGSASAFLTQCEMRQH